MGLLKLDSCCICISLDVGAKIIGFVATLFAVLTAALFGVPALLARLPQLTMLFYALLFVVSGLQFLTGCVMVVGLFQKRPSLMWPWLSLAWAVGAALLVLSGVGTIMLYVEARPTIGYVSSAYAVYALILLYFAAVVRSRREEILDEMKWDSGKRLMRPTALNDNVYV